MTVWKLYPTANSRSPVYWQDHQASGWIDTHSACGVGDDGCIGIYRAISHNSYLRWISGQLKLFPWVHAASRFKYLFHPWLLNINLDLRQYTILDYFARRSLSSPLNVGHLLWLKRWPRTLFPHYDFLTDYSKLPPSPPIDQVFLLDPLIATGGTACAALGMIVDWGIPGIVGFIISGNIIN